MNRENIHDKEELRSVRVTNRKIEGKVTSLSSGGLMGNVGTANEKIGRVAPLVSSGELMGSSVTCPGWEEADKRGRPRATTHHPLIFQNQQT